MHASRGGILPISAFIFYIIAFAGLNKKMGQEHSQPVINYFYSTQSLMVVIAGGAIYVGFVAM